MVLPALYMRFGRTALDEAEPEAGTPVVEGTPMESGR